jgi:hypothetical protein
MEDIGILDAMLSPIVPMSAKQESDQKEDEVARVSKMSSDTQILLAIFEKVVEIEDMLECKGEEKAAPDPSVFGTTPVQLEL